MSDLLHRAWIVAMILPMWAFATVGYLVLAPFYAADAVCEGIKKHWNDQ